MERDRVSLTEEKKIRILKSYDDLGPKWTLIGRLLSVNPNTARAFVKRYQKQGTLYPKMGRPMEITREIKDSIIGVVDSDPEMSLRELETLFDISKTSVRKILNDDKIKFHKKIAIPTLTESHKLKRVQFASRFANLAYHQMPNIIFTDESYVQVNLQGSGIWRRRGEYPACAFYEKDAYPIKCMVWGGIGPLGFRTTLIKIEGAIDSRAYVYMLHNNNIRGQIFDRFGFNFIFQQDNARPHTARLTQNYLDANFPNRLQWPAKSPDLSPIEQIWDYIKNKVAGIKFKSTDQLFNQIKREWDLIPDNIIHNCYSSFLARCKVCVQINGDCLNGHWRKVKQVHNSYRTMLP